MLEVIRPEALDLGMKSVHKVNAEQPNLSTTKSPPFIPRNVKTPKAPLDRFTAFHPRTPPLQHLMNLDIHSPATAQMNSSAFPNSIQKSHAFLRPKPKQHHKLAPAPSITWTSSASDELPPEQFLEREIGMPARFSAEMGYLSHFCTERSSSFDHHEGSPFKMLRPLVHNAADHVKSTVSTEGKATNNPSPRLVPLKIVPQNEARSKPYDPSTNGSHMKMSPLVKSLDITGLSDVGLEDPEVQHYASMNPNSLNQTPRQTKHEKGQPPLPRIKLTPRTTPSKRNLDQGEMQPFMMDVALCPSAIKLTAKSQRKVSVDESSISSMEWNASHPILCLPSSTKAGTCPIGTSIQFDNNDNKKQCTVKEMKRFPRTPKLNEKKSRSLLDSTTGSNDPLQSLLRADAMVEAARANEELTDDEDSDIECDPDYILYCPSSFVNRESKAFLSHRMSIGSAGGSNAKPTVPATSRLEMFPSLIGTIHKHGTSTNTLETAPVSVDTDCFERMRSDAGDCSLVLSTSQRDLFTPPPTFGEGNGFCTLSPPLLCLKRGRV